MSNQQYQLAQFSISLAKYPLDDPRMDGFTNQLQEINQLADGRDGFIWRLQSDAGDATAFRGYDNPMVLLNMSVWDSLKSLREFVFKSAHSGPYRAARSWFHELQGPVTALWWVEAGHQPTVEEGVARLEAVKYLGSTDYAFAFRGACPPPSADRPLSLVDRAAKEVVDLHQYFQQWFRGDIANDAANQARFMDSFDPLCELVAPNGDIDAISALSKRFLAAWKRFPDAKVWTSSFVPITVMPDQVLVKYREWREIDGETTVRMTTCLFSRDDNAPNGVKWTYIHETWLNRDNLYAPAPIPIETKDEVETVQEAQLAEA